MRGVTLVHWVALVFARVVLVFATGMRVICDRGACIRTNIKRTVTNTSTTFANKSTHLQIQATRPPANTNAQPRKYNPLLVASTRTSKGPVKHLQGSFKAPLRHV